MKNKSTIKNMRPIRSVRGGVQFADCSRLSRQYAIAANVNIHKRVMREYDGYSPNPGPPMNAEECIICELSFALRCQPRCDTLSVIMLRRADVCPVEVIFEVCRRRESGCDVIDLVFAEEHKL